MNELWQPVLGYEGFYEVSDQGRVRSLDRVVQKTRYGKTYSSTLNGKVLKPGFDGDGREQVPLSKKGKVVRRHVHSLVAYSFIGLRPEGLEIDHVNGDHLDNRSCNLEYVTHEENMRRAVALGLR